MLLFCYFFAPYLPGNVGGWDDLGVEKVGNWLFKLEGWASSHSLALKVLFGSRTISGRFNIFILYAMFSFPVWLSTGLVGISSHMILSSVHAMAKRRRWESDQFSIRLWSITLLRYFFVPVCKIELFLNFIKNSLSLLSRIISRIDKNVHASTWILKKIFYEEAKQKTNIFTYRLRYLSNFFTRIVEENMLK